LRQAGRPDRPDRHSAPDATARLSLDAVLGGREIVSMLNSGARLDRDYPRLIADIRSGRINVRDQVSRSG
jgi:S-(hydroxymethyl)glutathione dehydrogenase / alcohol dehydrogenase